MLTTIKTKLIDTTNSLGSSSTSWEHFTYVGTEDKSIKLSKVSKTGDYADFVLKPNIKTTYTQCYIDGFIGGISKPQLFPFSNAVSTYASSDCPVSSPFYFRRQESRDIGALINTISFRFRDYINSAAGVRRQEQIKGVYGDFLTMNMADTSGTNRSAAVCSFNSARYSRKFCGVPFVDDSSVIIPIHWYNGTYIGNGLYAFMFTAKPVTYNDTSSYRFCYNKGIVKPYFSYPLS